MKSTGVLDEKCNLTRGAFGYSSAIKEPHPFFTFIGIFWYTRPMVPSVMQPLLIALATFASTFLGGLFGIKHRDRLHLIISFTAGVIIGVVMFDILPEIFELTSAVGKDPLPALIAMVVGFFAFHILEKSAIIHGAHEGEYAAHRHPRVGLIGAIGLAAHSFLDGVGIGLGFQINPHVGFIIAIAVIAHDFSDGLNTVSLLLLHNHPVRRARTLLLIDALAPVLGVLVATIFVIPASVVIIYLGFFGGFLLYIGASDLLPEAHSTHSSYRLIALTALGTLFIFLVTRLL